MFSESKVLELSEERHILIPVNPLPPASCKQMYGRHICPDRHYYWQVHVASLILPPDIAIP